MGILSSKSAVSRLTAVWVLLGCCLSVLGQAAQAEQASLIQGTALTTGTAELRNSVHPLMQKALQSQAVGPMDGNRVLSNVRVVLSRSSAAQAQLSQLIAAQSSPSSAQYHHWLTPKQFGDQFGANSGDIAQITQWLKSKGLSVTKVEPSRSEIEVSGKVSVVQAAFNTQIKSLTVSGKTRFANTSNIQLPRAFANAIVTVRGLNNIGAKSFAHPHTHKPQFVNSGYFFFGPNDLAIQYNLNPLYSKGINGSGVTVAVAGQNTISPAIVKNYLSQFGITAKQDMSLISAPNFQPAQASEGDAGEAYLDAEMVSSLAYGAKLLVVTGGVVEDAVDLVVNNNLAGILSISYGEDEADNGTGNLADYLIYQQAAAQGITVMVSTGDANSSAADQDTNKAARHGLQVNGLASTPYNVAVGGTQPDFSNVPQLHSNTSTLSNLARYPGEIVWNDSCLYYTQYNTTDTSALAFCNDAATDAGLKEASGSGGGISSCVDTGASCTAGYPVPAWQKNVVGIQQWTGRAIPDVSMVASSTLTCDDTTPQCNIATGTVFTDYSADDGTSIASPVFASVLALVEQSQISPTNPDGRMGLINPLLYKIAAAQYGSSAATAGAQLSACNADPAMSNNISSNCVFNDITVGNNSSPCTIRGWAGGPPGATPSAQCVATGTLATGLVMYNGQLAYLATPGYDLATGLGSVNGANFSNALNALGAVQNLTVTNSGTDVILAWANDSNATSYNVYQASAPGAEPSTPSVANLSGNTYRISGLTSGQRYYFKVTANTSYGEGAGSNEASLVVPPTPPTGVSTSSNGTSVTLSWNATPSATSYAVFQGSQAGGETLTPVASNLAAPTVTLTKLTPGSTYYYIVAAYNVGGASLMSAEVNQTIAPDAPTVVMAIPGDSLVQLNWKSSVGAVSYNVFQGSTAGGEAATPVASVTSPLYTVKGLSNGSSYYFYVTAVNAGGQSGQSTEVSASPAGKSGGGAMGGLGLLGLIGLAVIKLITQRAQFRNR